MAESVDALDLKSNREQSRCQFKSGLEQILKDSLWWVFFIACHYEECVARRGNPFVDFDLLTNQTSLHSFSCPRKFRDKVRERDF